MNFQYVLIRPGMYYRMFQIRPRRDRTFENEFQEIAAHMVATLLHILVGFSKMADKKAERTFIMVKPDGVQRGLVGEIMKRFESRGYKLVACKMCKPGLEHLKKHYSDLSSKPFFPSLVEYMNSGPVVAMVWEGKEVVSMGRKMLGATNPLDSNPGTIRGDFCIDVGRNICHGSDAVESAKKEIGLWFSEDELQSWTPCEFNWVYE